MTPREAVLKHMQEILRKTEPGLSKHDDYRMTTQSERTLSGGKYLLPYQQRNAYRELRDWCKDESLSDEELAAKVKEKAKEYAAKETEGYNLVLSDFWNNGYFDLTGKRYYQD